MSVQVDWFFAFGWFEVIWKEGAEADELVRAGHAVCRGFEVLVDRF